MEGGAHEEFTECSLKTLSEIPPPEIFQRGRRCRGVGGIGRPPPPVDHMLILCGGGLESTAIPGYLYIDVVTNLFVKSDDRVVSSV